MTIQPSASNGAATATISPPAVEAANITKTYPRGVEALQGVSFSAPSEHHSRRRTQPL